MAKLRFKRHLFLLILQPGARRGAIIWHGSNFTHRGLVFPHIWTKNPRAFFFFGGKIAAAPFVCNRVDVPMHILLIHQAFAALDEPGGTRHHELARFLAAKGHRGTVIASPGSYLTGKSRQGRIAWVERQQDGEQITFLRAYTYPALHRSFAHR